MSIKEKNNLKKKNIYILIEMIRRELHGNLLLLTLAWIMQAIFFFIIIKINLIKKEKSFS